MDGWTGAWRWTASVGSVRFRFAGVRSEVMMPQNSAGGVRKPLAQRALDIKVCPTSNEAEVNMFVLGTRIVDGFEDVNF